MGTGCDIGGNGRAATRSRWPGRLAAALAMAVVLAAASTAGAQQCGGEPPAISPPGAAAVEPRPPAAVTHPGVSTTPRPSTTAVLIAAAIAIGLGGAWFVAGNERRLRLAARRLHGDAP